MSWQFDSAYRLMTTLTFPPAQAWRDAASVLASKAQSDELFLFDAERENVEQVMKYIHEHLAP